jgi:LmbE family N-acetylglucosaminyl deacetylase
MSKLTSEPSLFIRPHYDDVPLSCGSTVALLAKEGREPHMVTVFASELLPQMVGEFAAAAHALGCDVRWLGLPDAIYRNRYTSDHELFGPLPAEEGELASHLAEEIRHLPEWRESNRVFVPLGIGSHVDHQLVFEAGRCLAAQGVEVYAYEDCPYAIHTSEGRRTRLAALDGKVGDPVLVPIADTLEQRLEAIACCASQVPVIFRFTRTSAGPSQALRRTWVRSLPQPSASGRSGKMDLAEILGL